MAAGSIVIDLLMRTGSFETDTARAQKRLKSFERSVADTAKTVIKGFAAIGSVAGTAFTFVNIAEAAGQFKDLGEIVGDTAANVASLQLPADVSGTSMQQLAAASVKLTAALSATDESTDKVAKALAAINIPLSDFKQLSPVEQIRRVADEFAKFSDGAGKTAVAVALFGRAGAEMLPFLKELGSGLESSTKLTEEQIRAADQFTDDIKALKSELTTLARVVVADILPPFQAFVEALKNNQSTAESFSLVANGIATAFEAIVVTAANVAFVFQGVGREIAAIAAQLTVLPEALASGDFSGFRAISDAVKEDGERARKELDEFERRILSARDRARQQTQALSSLNGLTGNLDPRVRTQKINVDLGDGDKKGQAFLDRLKKQAAALQQNEFAALRIEAANLKVAGAAEFWIQKLEKAKALQESIRLFIEDATRAEKERAEVGNTQIDLSKQIKDIEFQTSLIGKSADAVEQLTAARQADLAMQEAIRGKEGAEVTQLIAIYTEFAKRLGIVIKARQDAASIQDSKVLNFGFSQELDDIRFATGLIGKTREQVELLSAARAIDRRQAQATFNLTGDALERENAAYARFRTQVLGAVEDQQRVLEQMRPLIGIAEGAGDAISSSFEAAIVEGKKLSDVLKQIEKDLLRILVRNLVTQPLGDAITKAILGAIGGIATGGGGSGGSIDAGSTGLGANIASARSEPKLTKTAGNQSIVINNNVDARGSDAAAIDRAMRASEARIMSNIQEARIRDPQYAS